MLVMKLVILLVSCNGNNMLPSEAGLLLPTELSDCKKHADSVYVIDHHSYSDKGNLKPPCSMSPDYCGCMEDRGIVPEDCN